jgi:hypothetical protein
MSRGRLWTRPVDISTFDLVLSVALGVALAAATGFRIFLPALIAGLAAHFGYLPLDENFAWLATPVALTMLGVAALVEIVAYYVPALDNLLDALGTPAALIAGTVLAAAVMTDLPPVLKWAAAIIAGGGIAGLTHGITAALRAQSTVFTAGIGNSAIATAELGGAAAIPVIAIAAPLIALALVAVMIWIVVRLLRRLRRRAPPPAGATQ